MKIDITKTNKKYIDEFLFIANNYYKIRSNPRRKIRPITYDAYLCGGLSIFIFIVFIVLLGITNKKMYLYLAFFAAVLILFSIIYFILICHRMHFYKKIQNNREIEVNKNGISVHTNDRDVSMKWSEMKDIIICKYTINFIPIELQQLFITVPSEYKDKLIKMIEKYKKDNLIVDQSK